MNLTIRLPIAAACLLVGGIASAQQWVEFQNVSGTDLLSDVSQPSLLTLGAVGSTDERTGTFATGDFDQDGDVDVVCFCKPPNWDGAPVAGPPVPHVLLLNDGSDRLGDVTLSKAPDFILHPASTREVIAADMDGDGDLDLVAANTSAEDPHIYRNLGGVGAAWQGFEFVDVFCLTEQGNRHFTQDVEGGLSSVSVTAGDVDNDGDLDLLFGCYINQQGVGRDADVYLENLGNMRFVEQTSTVLTAGLPNYLVMRVDFADMDRDGDLDIVMMNALVNFNVVFNEGLHSGVFDGTTPPVINPAPPLAFDYALADFNGDNWIDYYVTGEGSDTTSLNRRTSPVTWTQKRFVQANPTNTGADRLGGKTRAYDFDGDGILDIGIADMIKYGPFQLAATDGVGPYANPFMMLRGRVNGGGQSAVYDPETTATQPIVADGVWDFAFFDGNLILHTAQGLRYYRRQ